MHLRVATRGEYGGCMDRSVPQGQTFLVSRAPWDVPGTGKCAGRSGASSHGKPTLCVIPKNDQECPLSWKSPWDQSQDEPKCLPLINPHTWLRKRKMGVFTSRGVTSCGRIPGSWKKATQAWWCPVYAELSSSWCPAGGRVAEAGEHRTNSRPAGWQLAGPGGEEKLREGSGQGLSYTYRLGGRAGQGGGGDAERPHSSPKWPQRRRCALCPGRRRQEGLMGS